MLIYLAYAIHTLHIYTPHTGVAKKTVHILDEFGPSTFPRIRVTSLVRIRRDFIKIQDTLLHILVPLQQKSIPLHSCSPLTLHFHIHKTWSFSKSLDQFTFIRHLNKSPKFYKFALKVSLNSSCLK